MFEDLASHLSLGSFLDALSRVKPYRILHHWPQGEFHHDLVLQVEDHEADLPGSILVISSDCNGGLKEVICFSEVPSRWGLWHHRCPQNPDFYGELPPVHGWIKTSLWFDPCTLLTEDAASELNTAYRRRQFGGGWELADLDGDQ